MISANTQRGRDAWQAASTVEPRLAAAVVSDSAVTAITDARNELISANSAHTDVINGIATEIRAVRARIIDTHTDDGVVVATARAVTIATLKSALANPVFTAVGGFIGGAAGAAAGVAAGVGIAGALGGAISGGVIGSACIAAHSVATRTNVSAITYNPVDTTDASTGILTNAATHTSTSKALLGYSAANNRAVIADAFARAVSALTCDTSTATAAEAVANIAAIDEITNLQGPIHIIGNKNDSADAARDAARAARVAARAARAVRAATGLSAADLIARKIRDESVAIDANV